MSLKSLMKDIEVGKKKLDQLLADNKKEMVTDNIFDLHRKVYGAGWMARHDPEGLDRVRGIMHDEDLEVGDLDD